MICPHGLGIGHMLLDMLMAVPFVTSGIWFIRNKVNKKK